MKVGYIGGFWATNIGNSFYNLGALYLLKKVFGKENVYFIPDPPQWMWNVKKNYDFISKIDLDVVFISGPCFNQNIGKVYKEIFDNLTKKNIGIAFISSGAAEYTLEETDYVKDFLSDYRVEFIMTRDEKTYELYKNMNIKVFNGLCTSMFLNDEVKSIPIIKDENYNVFNFSKLSEPIIYKVNDKFLIKKRYLKKFQNSLDGLKIIRTNNSMFSRFKKFLFDRDNVYYSDLPYGYISILKNANLVFSDRVHTCACALIMGSKAMYVKSSKRSMDGRNNLFNRIGAKDIFNKPVGLDFDYINFEKKEMEKFLLEYFK